MYKYIHLRRVGLDGHSQGRREFASQGLPRFTSALYHAAQTVALEPWWTCLRVNGFLKLPCATTESWWICGGWTLFRCLFRLWRKTAIQTPKGARTYIQTLDTHPQKVLAPSITPKSQSLPPPAAATGFFMNFPVQSTFFGSTVDSVRREIWGACSTRH